MPLIVLTDLAGVEILCTDPVSDGSVCSGDSGGPLIDDATGSLVGVTSFGDIGCEPNDLPDGFARVSFFADWIQARQLFMHSIRISRRTEL